MTDFEKYVQKRMAEDQIPFPQSDMLWNQVCSKLNHLEGKDKKNMKTIRWMIAASILIVLIAGGFTKGPEVVHAATSWFNQIFGSVEQLHEVDPKASPKQVEDSVQIAQNVLTAKEFQAYSSLIKQQTQLMKKTIEIKDGQQIIHMDRLTQTEKQQLAQNEKELRPLLDKIDQHFVYSLNRARKFVKFPVKYPSYIPSGYKLKETKAESKETLNSLESPNPIFTFRYMKGEFGFTVLVSDILNGNDDEYSMRNVQNEVKYILAGNEVSYGKLGKNVTAMKMVVLGKNDKPFYQITMIADSLSKAEMEKIITSMP